MAGFFNQFLGQLGRGDEIKDYRHAAKTFVDGLYRLSPKTEGLFHVFINLNPEASAEVDQNSQIEIGLLAKSAQLPKFNVQTKTYNAYNRKNIVQERINYDPISITFHDDMSNIVRDFWYKYYSYYYRDSDHSEALYGMEHKYKQRATQEWGFTPKSSGLNFINAIRIYSLHQKSFSSYVLLNPTITNFQHGDQVQGSYEGLQHSMTIAYEAVQYEYGAVSGGTVQGFNIIHYDNSPSPLSSLGGGTTSILGPGGLVEGTSDVINNLANGNFGAAALGAFRTSNNFKNADLKSIAKSELEQTAKNILRGQNTQSTVFVPTQSSIAEGLSKAVTSVPGLVGVKSKSTGSVVNMNNSASLVSAPNPGRPT
jgi:hypothetical protein